MSDETVSDKHGLTHTWVWVHQTENNDAYTRIIYDDSIDGANIVCAHCGLIIPGEEYIAVVEKTRQYLHLGEDAHVSRLQEMLELIALGHENDERMALKPGDTVQKAP